MFHNAPFDTNSFRNLRSAEESHSWMLLYCPTDATVPALNTCSSCPSFAFDFFSSTWVYVTVPTIKSFLTLLPATHCCGYQLCFVTNRFMKLSYCLFSLCLVPPPPPPPLSYKNLKKSVYVLYSSEHCTVQNIGLRILFTSTKTLKTSLQGRNQLQSLVCFTVVLLERLRSRERMH